MALHRIAGKVERKNHPPAPPHKKKKTHGKTNIPPRHSVPSADISGVREAEEPAGKADVAEISDPGRNEVIAHDAELGGGVQDGDAEHEQERVQIA